MPRRSATSRRCATTACPPCRCGWRATPPRPSGGWSDAARIRRPREDGRQHGPSHPSRLRAPGGGLRLQRGRRQGGGGPRRERRLVARGPCRQARGSAHRLDHGAGRRPHRADRASARRAARRGRHDRRRRQHALHRRRPAGGRARAEGRPLRRRRHLRRRLGPAGGLLHDGRRTAGGGRPPRSDPRRAGAAARRAVGAGLGPHGQLRGRPLCEDGPQRCGVRPHAGLRRGLRAVREVGLRPRQRADRQALEPGLGGALLALRAGRARLRAGGQRPRRAQGLRERLRRGPLDDRGRHRQGRAAAGDHGRAVRALQEPRRGRLHQQGAGGAAQPVRGARRRARELMAVTQEQNPLVEGLERLPIHPTTLVIFGGTGDLAKRKLLPAIYNLAHEGALPERFNLIAVARSEQGHDDYRKVATESIKEFSRREPSDDVLEKLLERIRYVPGSFDDDSVYENLKKTAAEFDEKAGIVFNRVFYLSTAPSFFPVIVGKLGEHELDHQEGSEVRVVIEKPIGTNLAEALELNREVLKVLDESQAFRIDHYLGKETVQNMLAFRFANGMFEPVWSRNFIDYVQITAAEDLGVGTRAGYYDSSGALRDLVQNHMLQLLTLLCMEPPVTFSADDVRDEKVKVLHAIHAPSVEEVPEMAVRGQYSAGMAEGKQVPGYLEEDNVQPDSTTETYAALRLEVDNWRWAGVPIYLRTGKRLSRKVTEIAVTLKPVPHLAFEQAGSVGVQPNQIVMTMQPNEGVSLSFGAKIPGTRMRIRPVNMEFLYGTSFMSESPEAYERLLMDAMRGDATLFTRDDEVESQWRIIDPILQAWSQIPGPLPQYPAGSAGPEEADELMVDDDHHWRAI